MSEQDFDTALIAAAFRQAAGTGWTSVTVVDAARAAGLSLAEARARFPGKRTLLRRFGVLLDQAALAAAPREGPVRDRLFDLLMSRFDTMKPHREGIRALLRALPLDPAMALDLACATRQSMRWMLQAAGDPARGVRGALRVNGLVAVWTWTMRAFEQDESEDLSSTMAALDKALAHAHEAAGWLAGGRGGDMEADASMADAPGDDKENPQSLPL